MESLRSSETSVINSQSAIRNIPEDLDLQQHRRHDVKCRTVVRSLKRETVRTAPSDLLMKQ